MNTRIEMIKVMARPEIMGPAIGDSRERLIRERAELEDRLKNLREGSADRAYVESAIAELDIRIEMIKALSNPAPSNLQGLGVLRMP